MGARGVPERRDEGADDVVREPTVAALVQDAQRGNRDAFGELYRRFSRFVHGVALANAAPDDAGDIVQDTFVQAMNKLATLKEPAAFGTWVATIARNTARMMHRRDLRLVELPDDLPDTRPPSEDLDGDLVLAALKRLPEAYREPLLLRLVEGLSGTEIAERTGMTHGSVRVNLFRGMALLRTRLGGENADRE
jgi:RNA polymerase sigma-70 factor (ECF subfamily)